MWKYKKNVIYSNDAKLNLQHYYSLHIITQLFDKYKCNKTAFIWKKYIVSLLILLPILVNLIKVINPPPPKKMTEPKFCNDIVFDM